VWAWAVLLFAVENCFGQPRGSFKPDVSVGSGSRFACRIGVSLNCLREDARAEARIKEVQIPEALVFVHCRVN